MPGSDRAKLCRLDVGRMRIKILLAIAIAGIAFCLPQDLPWVYRSPAGPGEGQLYLQVIGHFEAANALFPSEKFELWWRPAGVEVLSDVETAPDGKRTADVLTMAPGKARLLTGRSYEGRPGEPYRFSLHIKKRGQRYIGLQLFDVPMGAVWPMVDLDTGNCLLPLGSELTMQAKRDKGGWWRVSLAGRYPASAKRGLVGVTCVDAGGRLKAVAEPQDVALWGAQLSRGEQLPAYLPRRPGERRHRELIVMPDHGGAIPPQAITIPLGYDDRDHTYTVPLPDVPLVGLQFFPIDFPGRLYVTQCRLMERREGELHEVAQGRWRSMQDAAGRPSKIAVGGWTLDRSNPPVRLDTAQPVLPRGMAGRNVKLAVMSWVYLTGMLWLLGLALWLTVGRPAKSKQEGYGMVILLLAAAMAMSLVANRTVIRNAVDSALMANSTSPVVPASAG